MEQNYRDGKAEEGSSFSQWMSSVRIVRKDYKITPTCPDHYRMNNRLLVATPDASNRVIGAGVCTVTPTLLAHNSGMQNRSPLTSATITELDSDCLRSHPTLKYRGWPCYLARPIMT
ncbi:hypothetical protein SARC_00029 [Sphaeroforma arctica JP610]|uniref:Uncharacterized protein n=1 Tax=Sphaeroforma arctica JP610 TaxID=667725 RepID=A0A0L0GFV4_9EUKA|nr:hypothetical protein SARC_00029 [Sphaeroforma arctica JP610]KNC87897.1 hypothetical protein SARC_00029 [Sphaeroforma arctica JP610]|eukprot:XP_014161799.1 hypothetical protein SARC_00029 [Sphaeroforma arctica JP610]